MEQMKQVKLSDWIPFSVRLYSKSYKSPDGEWMLKTVPGDNTVLTDQLRTEYKFAKTANKLGVPSPKTDSMVRTDDGSLGIIYEYVEGKRSISRAISEDPDHLEEYVRGFAEAVKAFHSREADTTILPPYEERVENGLRLTKIFSEEEKEMLRARLAKMPKETKCLHGDMQLSNAITSPRGNFMIDLGLMSYGHPLYDVGFFYHMAHFCSDALAENLFHFDSKTLLRCWELYARFYFESDDLAAIEETVKPFAQIGSLGILALVPDAETIMAAKEFILS